MSSLPRSVWFAVISGALFRLLFLLYSHHIYHPDELYQSVEIATRLVYGFGIIPWDYTYGLRSFTTPFLLAVPLFITKLFSNPPALGFLIIRIALALLSTTIIVGGYLAIKMLTKHPQLALVTAWGLAVWYELIYFSSRPLTENLSLISLSISLILVLHPHKQRLFLAGIFLSAACLWRIQYSLPIALGFFLYKKFLNPPQYKPLISGFLCSVTVFALFDFFTYGFPLIHIYRNLELSFFSKISQLFGVLPFTTYYSALINTTGGLLLLIPFSAKAHKANITILKLAIAVILLHSLIAHKEYRFILIAIPLLVILQTSTLYKILHSFSILKSYAAPLTISIVTIISYLGLSHSLPNLSTVYDNPPLYQDGVHTLLSTAGRLNSTCGVFIPDRFWVYTGGYSTFGKEVPLYSQDIHPSSEAMVNTLIIKTQQPPPPGYNLLKQSFGYSLYQRQGNCIPDANFSTIRSFEFLDDVLKGKTQYQFKFLN